MERLIPANFVERDHNEFNLGDHSVSYECTSLSVVSEWTVIVTRLDGRKAEKTYAQLHEDSAKYLFHDAYVELCAELDINPVGIE